MFIVVHWPVAFVPGKGLYPPHPTRKNEVEIDLEPSLVDTWKAMIKLLQTGKVRGIGVSNFSVSYLQTIIDATGVKPQVNQIEMHPLLPQDELRGFLQ